MLISLSLIDRRTLAQERLHKMLLVEPGHVLNAGPWQTAKNPRALARRGSTLSSSLGLIRTLTHIAGDATSDATQDPAAGRLLPLRGMAPAGLFPSIGHSLIG
jgi:hypothetical protein